MHAHLLSCGELYNNHKENTNTFDNTDACTLDHTLLVDTFKICTVPVKPIMVYTKYRTW